MSIDMRKDYPAPWRASDDEGGGNFAIYDSLGNQVPYLYGFWEDEGKLLAESIALAHNAFDVMMKHDPEGAILWLTDTEKWYRENIEKDSEKPADAV